MQSRFMSGCFSVVGSVVGTVKDSTGAVMPNAKVRVINMKPVNPWPKNDKTSDPGSGDFDTNNVFNNTGLKVPSAEGISSLACSFGGYGFHPRQMQRTMRLEW